MNENLKRGFTLIELVAVVGILGITATLILPQATGYIEKSQKATCDEQREILEREMVTRNVSDTNTYSINAEGYRKLLSESHNGSIQCPAGGTYTWYALSDTSGYIECSVHGHDAPISGTAAEDDGDTGNITSVVVTDTSGNKYTITGLCLTRPVFKYPAYNIHYVTFITLKRPFITSHG
jgi:prepilin-type N-terminal cleavage/methylation domain-containing protein